MSSASMPLKWAIPFALAAAVEEDGKGPLAFVEEVDTVGDGVVDAVVAGALAADLAVEVPDAEADAAQPRTRSA